jgi:hypothetical protein
MLLDLWNLFAIEEREQIAEARVSDQKFQSLTAAE